MSYERVPDNFWDALGVIIGRHKTSSLLGRRDEPARWAQVWLLRKGTIAHGAGMDRSNRLWNGASVNLTSSANIPFMD